MRLKFFAVPIQNDAQATDELNAFLASHRVLSVERQLIHDGSQSFWAVCVTYSDDSPAVSSTSTSKKARVDYQEVLSPTDFAVFAKLRDLRRDLSAQAGVPPYALFTNEQLAAFVTERATSLAALEKIDGVGVARVEKYGGHFVKLLQAEFNTESASDETIDSQP